MNEPILSFEEWCKTIPKSVMERCHEMSPNSRNAFLQTLFAGYGLGYLEICELKAENERMSEALRRIDLKCKASYFEEDSIMETDLYDIVREALSPRKDGEG